MDLFCVAERLGQSDEFADAYLASEQFAVSGHPAVGLGLWGTGGAPGAG